MSIPLPEKYMRPEGGIGKLANLQGTQADTLYADEEVPYGSPVAASEGKATVFDTDNFFGVAIADNFAKEIPYENGEKEGSYPYGKPVAVLRKGSIWVKATEDVKQNEKAAVESGGFKKAATPDEAIGVFQSTAQAGALVVLQINLP